MKRTLAYPLMALLVVAVALLANWGVFVAGNDWFVARPSVWVPIRNVGAVALLLLGWWMLPTAQRSPPAGTFLLLAGLLLGIGSAMQFRLGHDAPRRVSAEEATAIADSVRADMGGGVPDDSVRRAIRRAISVRNTRMRRDFEASRIDTRLARSLEEAYGPTEETRQILERRRVAPSDSPLLRFLPIVIALIAIVAAARLDLIPLLTARWTIVGLGGSIAIAVATWLYLKFAGGIRGASFAPQELLKLALPIAWGGLLVRYRDAFDPELRDRFTRSPFTLWLFILALLSAPLVAFVLVRDFGQFLVIGIAQTLLLAWLSRSPMYIVLFAAAFIASGFVLLAGALPVGVSLGTALLVVAVAVVILGWLERFRRKDVIWTSASLVLVGYVALAAILSRLPMISGLLATPRSRFLLWADLYARHGSGAWWDRARQMIESLYAFDAGGVAGAGLGRGTPFLVSNANTDFIFAALVEETGMLGGAIVILAFAAMVAIGLRLATELGRDSFAGLMLCGYTLLLGSQALVHIAGTMNLLPMTGITLPLVSSGLSSLTATMAIVGLVVGMAGWGRRKGRLRIGVRERTTEGASPG